MSSLKVARLEKEVDRLVLPLPDADVQRCLGMPDDVYDALNGTKILAAMHTTLQVLNPRVLVADATHHFSLFREKMGWTSKQGEDGMDTPEAA
jgi:hypothetical protein